MNRVEPIKSLEKINKMREFLASQSERNEMILLFGIYTGMRISDMLNLKIKDVKGKKYIKFQEKKTSKTQILKIPDSFLGKLKDYVNGKNENEYMFPGRSKEKPITRSGVHRILKRAAEYAGASDVSCHSLRKTYGYFIYQETKDVATLMQLFNHSDPSITLLYIGITQIEKDKAANVLNFM